MAMQPIIGTSSSSSLKKYDAFISFHGKDTRRKFTNYLYDALNKKVETFIDENKLKKGDKISSIFKSIEEAYLSVVIFSKNYASSKWCLDELVKILECKKEQGQIVIPIFYEVDPSHVRNQVGSYGKAFAKHEQNLRHNKDKLQKWRNALEEAANISGWHSQNYRTELDFIKHIVEEVFKQLNRKLSSDVNKEIVGIEKKYKEIELSLEMGSADVKTLGLWGMGGIGKTTLAEYAYIKLSFQFEVCCLLKNVREVYEKEGPSGVHKLRYSKLFELPLNAPDVDTPNLDQRLADRKSLIVLDDVATLEQAENLNGLRLGPGSRVIVTTRDKQILSQFDECKIYEVKGLNKDDSRQLFCLHAFQKKHEELRCEYEELIERAIGYCGGNPLALKVLGANFRTKSKEVWESELEKLKKIPKKGIHDVLKLSFDHLDCTERNIFLDIVCFLSLRFSSFDSYHKRDYLTVLFDACEFYAVCGIETLLRKALIAVDFYSSGDIIQMHDLLVEMGREIVKQESPKNPGRRSRLWDSEVVYDVLKNNEGTELVEVLFFNISKIKHLSLRSDSFKSMIKLRYLHITSYTRNRRNRVVHLPEGLEWLPDKLRHLYWDLFPLASLPSSFCAEKLVILSMRYSNLRKLWNGVQKLDNLITLDLWFSSDLIEIPDLSRAPKLQKVELSGCVSLRQLHPSVFTRPKLRELCLDRCKMIESLKTNIHSKSFQSLSLSNCSSLVEFSVASDEMTGLSLHATAIHEFPSSIWSNSKLTNINLRDCKKLNIVRKKLSTDLGLRSLTTLYLSGCTKIDTSNLWFFLDGMPSLKELDLRKCCNLETLPNNIQNNSLLEILNLDECSKLKSLPKLPKSLKQLTAFNCTYLDSNTLQGFHFNFGNGKEGISDICYLPGGQVPHEFVYHTKKTSIVIPPIPKSGLCCFIFCIVLSEGFNVGYDKVACTIYEHGKVIHQWDGVWDAKASYVGAAETLIVDHVLLCSWNGNSELTNVENESGGDHYNLSFEFEHLVPDDEEEWSTEGIKGCGVFPVYGLEYSLGLDGRSRSSGVEIVESQSSAQVSDEPVDELDIDEFDIDKSDEDEFDIDESDEDELLNQAIGAEFGGSSNENEDDQQQLLIPPKKRRRT